MSLAGEYIVTIRIKDDKKDAVPPVVDAVPGSHPKDAGGKGGSRRRQRRHAKKSKKRANKRRTRSRK